MKIHEYQAKSILARHGVPIPRGDVAFTPAEARRVAERLGGGSVVVKAQIHAGGRGKGGGVKLAKDPAEAERIAGEMLGRQLVTHQTGPQGRTVSRLLIEQGLDITRELYLGLVLDRAAEQLVVMASSAGGVDIEDVAARTPDRILREQVLPAVGLAGFQARKLAFGLGLDATQVRAATDVMTAVYTAYCAIDASLIEINPLVVTASSQLLALDAKITLDDNSPVSSQGSRGAAGPRRRGAA